MRQLLYAVTLVTIGASPIGERYEDIGVALACRGISHGTPESVALRTECELREINRWATAHGLDLRGAPWWPPYPIP